MYAPVDAASRALEHSALFLRLLKLQSQAAALCAQAADWAGRVDWDHLRPVICVDAGILTLCALLLFQPSRSEAEEQTFWTNMALGGRWMVSGAGVATVVFLTANGVRVA
jgi:hypothetical protein